jgi:hypothetical protein
MPRVLAQFRLEIILGFVFHAAGGIKGITNFDLTTWAGSQALARWDSTSICIYSDSARLFYAAVLYTFSALLCQERGVLSTEWALRYVVGVQVLLPAVMIHGAGGIKSITNFDQI